MSRKSDWPKKGQPARLQPSSPMKWWRQPLVWVGGVFTALIVAIATAFGTGVGNDLLSAATSRHAPTHYSPAIPVKIEQVTPFSTAPNFSFVVPRPLVIGGAQLAGLNSDNESDIDKFEIAEKAVPTGEGFTSVTVMGNASKTVTITGMQVIKQCGTPLRGTFFYNPPAGGAPTIGLGFDLDSSIDYAQNVGHYYGYSGNFFQDHVVTLEPGESQTFTIYVSAIRHYCRFYFQMSVATAQGDFTENILPGGGQFQLTGSAAQWMNPHNDTINCSFYQAVYIGGVADPGNDISWMRVNPKTYNGLSTPTPFPSAAAGLP
jgi:hypothetical protein